jgi:hypothetical protein
MRQVLQHRESRRGRCGQTVHLPLGTKVAWRVSRSVYQLPSSGCSYLWLFVMKVMRLFIYMTSNSERSEFDSALMSRFHSARIEHLSVEEMTSRVIRIVQKEIDRAPPSEWPIVWDATMGSDQQRKKVFNTLIQQQCSLYSGTQPCELRLFTLYTPLPTSDTRQPFLTRIR